MPSAYAVTATFGSLIFLSRHQPGGEADLRAVATAVQGNLDGGPLEIDAQPEALTVLGVPVPLDAPGATMVNEHMLLHGLRTLTSRGTPAPDQLMRLARVLAAFPGTFATFEDLTRALGPDTDAFTLGRGPNEFEVFRALPFRPRTVIEPGEGGALDFERIEGVTLGEGAAEGVEGSVSLSGEHRAPPRPTLQALLKRGQEAIAKEDWPALLENALQISEAEAEAPSELTGSTYRIELKRLMSRRHLAAIARLAQGERRHETITLLKRFGSDATEVLMDLLVSATSMGERRGFYSALVQMPEGNETIIGHLTHSQWYVVRNAADLCGEMRIAEAVPELVKQIAHPDERVRKSVAEALGKIATPAAAEPLRLMLADTAESVRLQAVSYLGGRAARGLAPAIGEMLKTEQNADIQQEALRALGRIGTPDAIALLREAAAPGGKLLGRKPLSFRLTAIRSLGTIGPTAQDALNSLSRDESPEVRAAAAEALASFRP
ncbi:MAG: HEAT repeat domain-containing protein [Gemmatimonadales bacterium]